MKNQTESIEVTQLRDRLESANELVDGLSSSREMLLDDLTTALEVAAALNRGEQEDGLAETELGRRHISELKVRLKRSRESIVNFREAIYDLKQELAYALGKAIELHQAEVEAERELGGES